MSEFNIEVQGGSSVRLPTAGKYCEKDIIVTASGSGGDWYDFTVTVTSECVNGQELLDVLTPYLSNMQEGKEYALFTLQSENILSDSKAGIAITCCIMKNLNDTFTGAMARYRANLVTYVAMTTGYSITPYAGCTYYVKVVRVIA